MIKGTKLYNCEKCGKKMKLSGGCDTRLTLIGRYTDFFSVSFPANFCDKCIQKFKKWWKDTGAL